MTSPGRIDMSADEDRLRGSLSLPVPSGRKTSAPTLAAAMAAATSTASTPLSDLLGQSPRGESSNVLIGPGGVLVPRSSILLNPSTKKTFVENWRSGDGAGPAVLHIPAPQTARDREIQKEKERIEREREIERELKEMEQAEKVWGIPKKAFYMGLGEINFNAQMAMLGGWGNGSGPATDFRPGMMAAPLRRPSSRSVKSGRSNKTERPKSKQEREKDKERFRQEAIERERAERKRREREKAREEDEDSDADMDPEELASLNAIINTRRSMEAAQAVASRISRPSGLRKSISQSSLPQSASSRPSLQRMRNDSTDSTSANVLRPSAQENSPHSYSSRPSQYRSSSDLQKRNSSIRFAPLPQAYGPSTPTNQDRTFDDATDADGVTGDLSEQLSAAEKAPAEVTSVEGYDYSDVEGRDEGDESWSRRLSTGLGGSMSKWYSLPKLKAQSGRSIRRPTSAGYADAPFSELSTSPSQDRTIMSPSERRGRRSSKLLRNTSLAGSTKSRSSSVGSHEDGERRRRRDLIRATRPGGTGMVTLPDGTKIRARRVGEDESEEEEDELGTPSRRQSFEEADKASIEPGLSEKRLSDEEGPDEHLEAVDGISWAKRRKRERMEGGEAVKKNASPLMGSSKDGDVLDNSEVMSSAHPLSPPSLSASRAAEVRRRHEEEVAALGAEVLQNLAKAKKVRQPVRSATMDVNSSERTASPAARTTKPIHQPRRAASVSETAEVTDLSTIQPVPVQMHSSPKQIPDRANTLQSPRRQPSAQHSREASEGTKTPTKLEITAKKSSLSPAAIQSPTILGISSDENEGTEAQRTPQAPASPILGLMTTSPTGTATPTARSRPLSRSPSRSSRKITESPSSSMHSALARNRSPNRGNAIYIPVSDLPRKPDARGYAIVPLPIHQLGRRPERPREGRVWQFDDEDDLETEQDEEDGEKEEDEDTLSRQSEHDKEDDEEEEEDETTMNAEELAEEERRTAMQKKRATTRAAGAEIVSGVSKSKGKGSSTANVSTSRQRSEDDDTSSELSSTSSEQWSKHSVSPSLSPASREEGEAHGVNHQPMVKRNASTAASKNKTSTGDRRNNDSTDEEDAALWPPSLSTTALSRTLSARDSKLSLASKSSQGKISNHSSGGAGRSNPKNTIALAAHSAKTKLLREKKSKEAKEKERLRILKLKENDEYLDYGWPHSLQGSSLYH